MQWVFVGTLVSWEMHKMLQSYIYKELICKMVMFIRHRTFFAWFCESNSNTSALFNVNVLYIYTVIFSKQPLIAKYSEECGFWIAMWILKEITWKQGLLVFCICTFIQIISKEIVITEVNIYTHKYCKKYDKHYY